MPELIGNRRNAQTIICILLVFLSAGSGAISETNDGFITNVESSTRFDIGKMRVALRNSTECDRGLIYGIAVEPSMGAIPLPSAWYLLRPGRHTFRFDSIRTQRISCSAVHFTVGSRVHLTGTQAPAAVFAANSVLVYAIQRSNSLNGSSVLEKGFTRRAWEHGVEPVWIDGYKLNLTPSTKFQSALGRVNTNPYYSVMMEIWRSARRSTSELSRSCRVSVATSAFRT